MQSTYAKQMEAAPESNYVLVRVRLIASSVDRIVAFITAIGVQAVHQMKRRK